MAESENFIPCEVAVTEESRLVGRTASKVGLGWRKSTILLGISRKGRPIKRQTRKTVIRAGDILLLLIPKETYTDVINWLNCLPLADRGLNITNTNKMKIALLVFFGLILTSIGIVKLPIILGVVVIIYCLLKIIPIRQVYKSVEWPVIVLLASIIPLGAALETNGTTSLIVDALTNFCIGLEPWLIISLLMILTMTLSDMLNNTATTIVIAPIGIKLAENLHMNPDTFLMAIAIAASCAFLTPIGHKNNTIILGPGGYSFADYWRVGLPLECLILAVSVPTLLFFWPL